MKVTSKAISNCFVNYSLKNIGTCKCILACIYMYIYDMNHDLRFFIYFNVYLNYRYTAQNLFYQECLYSQIKKTIIKLFCFVYLQG